MNQPNQAAKKVPAIVGLFVLALLIVAGVTATSDNASNNVSSASAVSQSASPSAAPNGNGMMATTGTTAFKDGVYKATGSFDTPAQSEAITVSLTVNNGIVTASSAQTTSKDNTSARYGSSFVSSYRSQVVGRPIDQINLSRVSGSSLTTQGFNTALIAIRAQAHT